MTLELWIAAGLYLLVSFMTCSVIMFGVGRESMEDSWGRSHGDDKETLQVIMVMGTLVGLFWPVSALMVLGDWIRG